MYLEACIQVRKDPQISDSRYLEIRKYLDIGKYPDVVKVTFGVLANTGIFKGTSLVCKRWGIGKSSSLLRGQLGHR